MKIPQALTAKHRSLKTKLALAVASVSSIAILGSAGIAAAAPQQTMYLPSREACKTQWSAFKFKNRGACESYWNRHKPHGPHGNHGGGHGGGHGYGGNNGGVTVVVNGNNNVISIVINYFFGG